MVETELKEAATNNETRKHISKVVKYMNVIIKKLLSRVQDHDASKLVAPELAGFTIHTENLKGCTYGSHQYDKFLEALWLRRPRGHRSSDRREEPKN